MPRSSFAGSAETFVKAIVPGFGADRVAVEGRLQAQGILIAVTERVELLRSFGHTDAVLLIVGGPTGETVRATNIAAAPSRALPGHRRLRVARFGGSDIAAADAALLKWVAEYGRRDLRCLALTVELFDRDAKRRARLASTLANLGFEKVKRLRTYQTTLALDLTPTAEELFARLTGDTRRSIRAPLKHKLELRPIEDIAFADRIAGMVAHTFARTGGTPPQLPWKKIIDVSARQPALSRISGVFDPHVPGPDSLVSFAWGVTRGEYTTYEAGATVRRKDLGSTSLGYAPLWDLVVWARANATSWFDFGGVTAGHHASANDPVGGISAFKRSFCQNVVDVGEEWVLHPHPLRSAIASVLGSAARLKFPKRRGTR